MRSRRLATLERLAAMAERSARLRLARANQELKKNRRQQEQLESYDAEYAQRWLAEGRAGVGGRRLLELGVFRASLARTMDTQSAVIRGAQAVVAQEASGWRSQRERLRLFGELVEKARRGEEREADRRAQRALDDLAGRSPALDL